MSYIEIHVVDDQDEMLRPVRFFRIRLHSKSSLAVGGNRISYGDINANEPGLRGKLMVLGGALAERQNEEYLDSHDPDQVAKAVGKIFDQYSLVMRNEKSSLLITPKPKEYS
jgi:hypothetical protein